MQRAHRGLTTLHLAGFELSAVSIGGQETCLVLLPSFRLAFDIGRCPQRACYAEQLLLTHTHLDHVGGLGPYVATRSLLALQPPTVYCPSSRVAGVEAYLASLRALDGSDMPALLVGTTVGESFLLNGGRHSAVPFQTDHPVPCNGYTIFSHRQKLKSEFVGLPGAEIARKRKAGEVVCDDVCVAEVAFTGDTTAAWVHHPSASAPLTARLLIMECTFVDDNVSPEDAHRYGHTHLDEICANAALFEKAEAILLVHFSARYKREEIVRALETKLPPSLRGRVTPLLEGYS